MTETFPSDLALAKASVGSHIDLQHLQNRILQQALEDHHTLLAGITGKIAEFCQLFNRQIIVLSPMKDFLNATYA